MLVQISETIFGDQFSRNNLRGKPRQFFGLEEQVSKGISAGVSALKNKALQVFDKANQGNVAKKLILVLPSPHPLVTKEIVEETLKTKET